MLCWLGGWVTVSNIVTKLNCCFCFPTPRDKKETLGSPQARPQKDRKYGGTACLAKARHTFVLVYLLIQVLFVFAGRAWCHGSSGTTWPYRTKGKTLTLHVIRNWTCVYFTLKLFTKKKRVNIWKTAKESRNKQPLVYLEVESQMWNCVFTRSSQTWMFERLWGILT